MSVITFSLEGTRSPEEDGNICEAARAQPAQGGGGGRGKLFHEGNHLLQDVAFVTKNYCSNSSVVY